MLILTKILHIASCENAAHYMHKNCVRPIFSKRTCIQILGQWNEGIRFSSLDKDMVLGGENKKLFVLFAHEFFTDTALIFRYGNFFTHAQST